MAAPARKTVAEASLVIEPRQTVIAESGPPEAKSELERVVYAAVELVEEAVADAELRKAKQIETSGLKPETASDEAATAEAEPTAAALEEAVTAVAGSSRKAKPEKAEVT